MKNLKFGVIFPLVCFIFLASSCGNDVFNICTQGEGALEIREIDLEDIEGLDLRMSADIKIIDGDEQKITIESESNIIDKILDDSEVEKGIWEIKFKGCQKSSFLEITVTIPELSYLKISGSGNIESEGQLLNTDENMDLRISGSGDMDLELGDLNSIDMEIAGSGSYELSGTANESDIKISGSGDIMNFDMIAQDSKIHISGSGDAQLTAIESLDASISGSGDICYKGNPSVESSVSGSGDIKKCD